MHRHAHSHDTPSGTWRPSSHRYQQGFTLIELMMTVVVIAILAAIAMPSYRQYVIRSHEAQAQASMQQVQIQLQRWRASALTYKGFRPKKTTGNTISHAYDEGNTTIYVPAGSDADSHHYQITLVDGDNPEAALASEAATVDNVTGRSWKMLAAPNPDGLQGAYFVLTSEGMRCQNQNEIAITAANCGDGQQDW